MVEVVPREIEVLLREIEVMIHDRDWFCAFQPSADRLTPDTIHNTGKRPRMHTQQRSNPRGLEPRLVLRIPAIG